MFLTTAALLFNMGVQLSEQPQATNQDSDYLLGQWQIDLTPTDSSDYNFATMTINDINDLQFFGEFYRTGVTIQNGRLNTSNGKVYGALISADGTGQYASSFYLNNGKLYGTTHSLDRKFLSVWTAIKQQSASEK